jgi:transforming growth factor-beta-induced protein
VTIADIAVATPSLSTLVTTVIAVGLGATLDSPVARLTVFAPSNDAFATLPAALFAALLTPAFGQHLTNVLLYHIILSSVLLSTDLSDGLEVTMLNGELITVVIDGDSVSLANSEGVATMVSTVDTLSTNGVVHLLDGVLLPSFIYRTVIDLGASYSTLFSLLSLAGLEETLRGDAWTLFAPTNDAFGALPEETLAFLVSSEDLETLTGILTYHVVPAVLTSDKFSDGAMATTIQGSTVTIGITNGAITVNNIAVSDADNLAINGVTHGIDGVLMPPPPETDTPTVSPATSSPTAAPETMSPTTSPTEPRIVDLAFATPSLSTLVIAVTTAGLIDTLADPAAMLTVFAPSNDAFASLPDGTLDALLTPAFSQHLTNVLLYHVLGGVVLSTDPSDGLEATMMNGEILTVGINGSMMSLTSGNGAVTMVSAVGIMASNGVVHLIDGVLLPSFVYRTVLDVGATYSTLLALVELAGLRDSLMGGQFTLFAPNDDAFGKLPRATLDFLTNSEGRDSLADILTYHVISMVLTSDKLTNPFVTTTLQGGTVSIDISGDTVTVNDSSTIIEANILAINGVTHGIDTVLVPDPGTSAPTIAPTTSAGAALCTSFLGLLATILAMAF